MKLFHKTPEGGLLKTGINITTSRLTYRTEREIVFGEKRIRFFCLYLVKENFGFMAVYLTKFLRQKWRLTFKPVLFSRSKRFTNCY